VTFTTIFHRARPVGTSGFVQLRFASVARWEQSLIQRQTEHLDIDEARAAAERLADERSHG
jgi:hypothetical protein